MRASTSSRRGLGAALGPALGLVLGAGVMLAAGEAAAYCRTSVCDADFAGAVCTPPQATDCGVPLFWNRNCLGVSLQRDASLQVELETVRSLVAQAFASWQSADCGGAPPGLLVQLDKDVSCDEVEYNQRGGNANIIMFRDDFWPHGGMGNTLALTTVTFNKDTAEIYDADMEVNSTPAIELTVSDTKVVFDLLSILTHEAGHMLGLAHSEDPDATMYVEYIPGDISIRDLESDDEAGICDAYPPKAIDSCDIEPRHGFKSSCGPGDEDEDDGCDCAIAPPGRDLSGLNGLLLLAGLSLLRRRRRA